MSTSDFKTLDQRSAEEPLLTISQQHCSERVLPHLNMLRARDREPRNEDKNAVGDDQGHSRSNGDCSKDTRQMRRAQHRAGTDGAYIYGGYEHEKENDSGRSRLTFS